MVPLLDVEETCVESVFMVRECGVYGGKFDALVRLSCELSYHVRKENRGVLDPHSYSRCGVQVLLYTAYVFSSFAGVH